MGFDAMSGFKVGQELGQGQSALGAMVKHVTEALKKKNELQQEAGFKFQGELALEKEKSRLTQQRVAATAGNLPWNQKGAGGGGVPPVGTTMSYDPSTGESKYNIPLNPDLTQDESTISAITPEVRRSVDRLKQIVPGTSTMERLGTKLPFIVSRTLGQTFGADPQSIQLVQEIKQKNQQLTSSIPFTFGGKQLTDTEKKVFTDLLETTGKPDDLIVQDYDRFVRIFDKMDQAIMTGMAGVNAANDQALFAQILQEEGLGSPNGVAAVQQPQTIAGGQASPFGHSSTAAASPQNSAESVKARLRAKYGR